MVIAINSFYGNGNIHCMSTPGLRLKALRKEKGLSQVQLAAIVRVDQSTISDIENEGGLSAENLMRLCEALQTTPQFVMRGKSDADDLLMQIKALVSTTPSEINAISDRDGKAPTKVVHGEPTMVEAPKKNRERLGLREFQVTGKGLTDETDKARRVSKQRSGKRA